MSTHSLCRYMRTSSPSSTLNDAVSASPVVSRLRCLQGQGPMCWPSHMGADRRTWGQALSRLWATGAVGLRASPSADATQHHAPNLPTGQQASTCERQRSKVGALGHEHVHYAPPNRLHGQHLPACRHTRPCPACAAAHPPPGCCGCRLQAPPSHWQSAGGGAMQMHITAELSTPAAHSPPSMP